MSTYTGLLKFNDDRNGEQQLEAGRAARAIAEAVGGGGRFLHIYWTEGDADLHLTYEGRTEEQAMSVFTQIEQQQNATICVVRALAEGEKERAIQGEAV